jgi:acyl-CoA thioesterase YciA
MNTDVTNQSMNDDEEHASGTAGPHGELLLRTLAMLADTNPGGDIFGGWLMSQMDMAGAILVRELTRGRCVTVAVDAFKFQKPVKVGDAVACHGRVIRIGTTSVTLKLEVWVKPCPPAGEPQKPRFQVTEAIFTYVAVDDAGKKRPVPDSARAAG